MSADGRSTGSSGRRDASSQSSASRRSHSDKPTFTFDQISGPFDRFVLCLPPARRSELSYSRLQTLTAELLRTGVCSRRQSAEFEAAADELSKAADELFNDASRESSFLPSRASERLRSAYNSLLTIPCDTDKLDGVLEELTGLAARIDAVSLESDVSSITADLRRLRSRAPTSSARQEIAQALVSLLDWDQFRTGRSELANIQTALTALLAWQSTFSPPPRVDYAPVRTISPDQQSTFSVKSWMSDASQRSVETSRLRKAVLRLESEVARKREEVSALTADYEAQSSRRSRARAALERRFAEKCAAAGLPDFAELEAELLALQRENADLRALKRRDPAEVKASLNAAKRLQRLSAEYADEERRLTAIVEKLEQGTADKALFVKEKRKLDQRRHSGEEEEEQLDARIERLDGERGEELVFSAIDGEKPKKAVYQEALGRAQAEERILVEWEEEIGKQCEAERGRAIVKPAAETKKEEEILAANAELNARKYVPDSGLPVTYKEAIAEQYRRAYELKGRKGVVAGSLEIERRRTKSRETIHRVLKKAAELKAAERSCAEKWEEVRELGEEAVAQVKATKKQFAKLGPLQERNRSTAELLLSIDIDRDPRAPVPPVDELLPRLDRFIATVLVGAPEDMRFKDKRQKREYEELADACWKRLITVKETN